MKFELYEIWAVDTDGNEDLIDTTNSITEAKELAQATLDAGSVYVTIYREADDGDLEVVEEFEA